MTQPSLIAEPITKRQYATALLTLTGIVLTSLSGGLGGALTGRLIHEVLLAPPPELSARWQLSSAVLQPVQPMLPPLRQLGQGQIDALTAEQLERARQLEQQRLTYTAPPLFQGSIVYEGNLQIAKDVIALTLDDGPWGTTTEQILDILKQEDVKATFFWVGQAAQTFPEIAARIVNEGHAIGNHTWHHRYHSMDAAEAASEIETSAQIFHEITGIETKLFRPPGGYLNNGLADYARSQGYTVVMWSITSSDTDPSGSAQAYIDNILQAAKPGAIILMHDGGGDRSQTVAALPTIIRTLKAQGYRFVTVPELLRLQEAGW